MVHAGAVLPEPEFPGFVAGGAMTVVPAQFFVDVMPVLDDPAELRAALYAFYALSRRRGSPRCVRVSEMAAEDPFRQAMVSFGGDAAISGALERVSGRGVLLLLALDDGDAVCFPNTDAGRRDMARVRAGVLRVPGTRARPRVSPPPEGGNPPEAVYEQEIGLLTPFVAEAIATARERWPDAWIIDALREAVRSNVRSWAYAEAILRRRDSRDGTGSNARPSGHRPGDANDHGPFERAISRD